ncbi:hypothetical protein BKA65DRAFT_153898 [Rhexocercosporidium sp. MPI-PUGE-AT-0058]|nr:hypothetical protein BKA65DRAFT_153898 [Rhexocercosporidium sp. MPI-PUGE-AT-0058]
MQFSTVIISSIFAAFAAAAGETVCIENLSIRDNEGIQSAIFDIQPADVTCEGSAPAIDNYSVVVCGDSAYRFAINGTNSVYTMRVYKELGPGVGFYGESDVLPVYCRAGGNGINDRVCTQVGDAEFIIDSDSD